ncbi:hypothetical protein AAAB32_09675, partial [Lactobacillus acidophilus]
LMVGHGVAVFAIADVFAKVDERFCQHFGGQFVLLQKVKDEAKGGFFSNRRKFGDFVDGIFYQFGGEIHLLGGQAVCGFQNTADLGERIG